MSTSNANGAAVTIVVDGRALRVRADVTVAAALLDAGVRAFRRSVQGEPRAPLCGMGICHECRVTIDGREQLRACLVPVRDGMVVATAPREPAAASDR